MPVEQPPRVVVVHPRSELADIVFDALAEGGCEVARAANAREARSAWPEHRPDLVLIDPALLDCSPNPLEVADLLLDDDAHTVTRAGLELALTVTEYRLLHRLMRHPGRVLNRAQLLEHVWGYDFGGDARVLETYVCSLRRKLEAAGRPRLIHTVRGVGYVLRAP